MMKQTRYLFVLVFPFITAYAHAQISDTGCSDGEREAFKSPVGSPNIAGCSGTWSVPGVVNATTPSCGRVAGDDITNASNCSAADLCAEGWHICATPGDVFASSPSESCLGAFTSLDPDLFFATRQSGTGNAMCEISGSNDLFGCGTVGLTPNAGTCAPLDRFSNNNCTSLPASFDCGANSQQEAANVVKTDNTGGGVLCCHDVTTTCDCFIEGSCWDDGEVNPANSCLVCDDSVAISTWTAVPVGTSCGNGGACSATSSCDTPGVCDSASTCDDELTCTTDACDTANSQCLHTVATTFCVINNACVAASTPNPANDCEGCVPASSQLQYSYFAGPTCDSDNDGIVDTVDGTGDDDADGTPNYLDPDPSVTDLFANGGFTGGAGCSMSPNTAHSSSLVDATVLWIFGLLLFLRRRAAKISQLQT